MPDLASASAWRSSPAARGPCGGLCPPHGGSLCPAKVGSKSSQPNASEFVFKATFVAVSVPIPAASWRGRALCAGRNESGHCPGASLYAARAGSHSRSTCRSGGVGGCESARKSGCETALLKRVAVMEGGAVCVGGVAGCGAGGHGVDQNGTSASSMLCAAGFAAVHRCSRRTCWIRWP